jgi:hypothetical protein
MHTWCAVWTNPYIYGLREGLEQRLLFKDSICILNSLCSSVENLDIHTELRLLRLCCGKRSKVLLLRWLESLVGVITMCHHELPAGRIVELDVAVKRSGAEREARRHTLYGTTTTNVRFCGFAT